MDAWELLRQAEQECRGNVPCVVDEARCTGGENGLLSCTYGVWNSLLLKIKGVVTRHVSNVVCIFMHRNLSNNLLPQPFVFFRVLVHVYFVQSLFPPGSHCARADHFPPYGCLSCFLHVVLCLNVFLSLLHVFASCFFRSCFRHLHSTSASAAVFPLSISSDHGYVAFGSLDVLRYTPQVVAPMTFRQMKFAPSEENLVSEECTLRRCLLVLGREKRCEVCRKFFVFGSYLRYARYFVHLKHQILYIVDGSRVMDGPWQRSSAWNILENRKKCAIRSYCVASLILKGIYPQSVNRVDRVLHGLCRGRTMDHD